MMIVDCGSIDKPDNIKALIAALKTCSGIDDAVAKLKDAELSNNLCAEERKDILKCIAKGLRVGTEDEQSIIRVIKTTPLGQKAKLIELISSEPNLLANLHSSIDGDDLTTYYKELIMLYRLSKPKQDWDNIAKTFDNIEAQQQKKPITEWAKQKIFFWLDVGLIDYITEGRIVYHNEEITSNNHLKFDQYTSVLAISLNELKGVDLAPFDIVRLHFLSENEQLGMPKGEYADIPAIALRFLIQKQFNRDAWVAVNTGFVLGTLGSGSIATLWGKVDCVLGLGAILEDNYHNQLTKTPEGQAVLTTWKVLNVALLARLGYKVAVSIPTAWKSLTEAIAKLRVKNPTLATQVENEAKQAFSEYNVADDIVRGSDDLSLINRFDNLTQVELKQLYTQLAKTEIQGAKTTVSQTTILAEIEANKKLINPYSFTEPIEDIVLSKEALFVRVHNVSNPNRPWLIAIEDFKKFSSMDDMIKRLALPILDDVGNVAKPTELSLVKLPIGTTVRKSIARPQDWPGQGHQPGGAWQYEIRGNNNIPKSWFQKLDLLSNYLK